MNLELRRFTTKYDAVEDRLCITGEDPQGSTLMLWLTQRLLNPVVANLCQWLDRQGGDTRYAKVMQEFQQQAAVASIKLQNPVKAPVDAEGILIRSVDITVGKDWVRLSFKGQETGPAIAKIRLQANGLRQWLGIVAQQSRGAGWRTDCWPDWIKDNTWQKKSNDGDVFH